MSVIRHTVAFALPFPGEGIEERAFLSEARALARIPGVQELTVLRALDEDAELPLSLSMQFVDRAGYDAYNNHPQHRTFVERVWLPNVTRFQETDYAVVPDHEAVPDGDALS